MKCKTRKSVKMRIRYIIGMPFIASLVIPLILTDIRVEIYHRICFPLYGIPLVKRSHYIVIDRHRLKYLSRWRRMNCAYCGYANGALQYWVKIIGDTEEYWCGVKHRGEDKQLLQQHHANFAKYGDEQDLRDKFYPQAQQ